ncbi:MAG: ImmA/IrrE family metallo-endopeptidase [Candidatus Binatia bacterium]
METLRKEMELKVIKSEAEYRDALGALQEFLSLDPDPGTKEAEHLELLSLLVRDYESRQFSFPPPDPVEAIKFRMEQQGLSQRDLVPYIGSRSKVSEILSQKRPLTLSMIRALHEGLGIPAHALLPKTAPPIDEELKVDWSRFPIREMIKRRWIVADTTEIPTKGRELMEQLLSPLRGRFPLVSLYRRSEHIRSGREMDRCALTAWTIRVLTRALDQPSRLTYKAGTITPEFMRQVARLSWFQTGPILAKEFLEKHGVTVVIEPHLPRTYLDGASIMMPKENKPVIGLTLRYDRLDNFWFCLMHELVHVARHLDVDRSFYDDFDTESKQDALEDEADKLAGDALIPANEWEQSPARKVPSPQAVQRLADQLGIHPGIVAGRIRNERKNYRLLNQLVGHGKVRSLFSEVSWE